MIELNQSEFEGIIGNFTEAAAQFSVYEKARVLYIYTTTCPNCKMVKPVLEKLEIEFNDVVGFYSINANEFPEFCEACSIMSVPSVVLIKKNGEPVMVSGYHPISVMRSAIENIL